MRLGELVPGGTIRHSLKLNIDSANFYPGFGGYRWPAWKSDAGGAGYGGSIPEVRMGSLLAPKADFPTNTLETEPGKILAAAFRDYGGYIVDTSGWSIYNFVTERSPAGSVQDEFNKVWGYSLNAGVGANGWARDLDKIFTNLYVVDSWDKATWLTVSASNGTVGVGLGIPRVPWAPEFGQVPPPPPPPPRPPPPPGLAGTTVMLTTSKSPSEINETVTVSGRLTDASGSPVAGRVVSLEWSADQTTWSSETQIGQFPAADASGTFTGRMAFRGSGDHSEFIRARFVGDATFATSLSLVVTQAVVSSAIATPLAPTTPPSPIAEPPATPARSEPVPMTPKDLLPTMMLLAVLSVLLTAMAAFLCRRVRMDRSSGPRSRAGRRTNASRRPLPFDDSDDDLEYPL